MKGMSVLMSRFSWRRNHYEWNGSSISELFPVVEYDLQFCVLVVELRFESVEIALAVPLAHRQIVEEVVSAGLRCCCRHFVLLEYPIETFDGQLSHVVYGVCVLSFPLCLVAAVFHDDVHASEAPHWPYVDDVFADAAVSEPSGHEVLHAVHGGRCDSRFFVWFGDSQVESCEPLVLS